MKILFVGESWLGSCARSLREALARLTSVELDEFAEDRLFPSYRGAALRAMSRLARPLIEKEFERQLLARVDALRPDVLVAYKGYPLAPRLLRRLRTMGVPLVNVYPDCSPHAYGMGHREAVGLYDLVISTKPFHPSLWRTVYGYGNDCAHVPQGYDPLLHLFDIPGPQQPVDVCLVATWRPEYDALMRGVAGTLAATGHSQLRISVGGPGWEPHRASFPAHWEFPGPLQGRSYVKALRSAKTCIAPVMRRMQLNGVSQPGDEDSTRTYELAAAHCFFIHRRTKYVQQVYDEASEVPMFDDADELATAIIRFHHDSAARAAFAANAHRRAVPAYSLDERARAIAEILEGRFAGEWMRTPK